MSDPISATIVAFTKFAVAVAKAYKAYKIVRIAVMVASAIAISAVAKAMTPKGASRLDQGQEIALKLDPTMPRQVAVGRTTTGGSLVWAFTYTDNAAVPNAYLVRIIALSDRPIEGVVAVLEGKQRLEFTGDIYAAPQPCTSHKIGAVPYMLLHVVKGYDNMTSLGYLQDWSGGRWTAKHKGVGIAYAVVRYLYNADAFPNGEPQLQFIVDGAHVYDDRHSTDLGGSQHLADPATWTFSRNPATISAHFLRGFKTLGSLIVGGQIDGRDLNPEVVIAAANTCDEVETLEAGGTEPRYRAGMMLTSANSVADDLDQLRLAMDGQVFDRGGEIAILPGGTRTSVMVLDDNDVNWAEERSFQPIANLSALYNHVQGSYVPEELDFTQESYPIRTDPDYVIQDGGEKIIYQQDFKAVNSSSQVQRITARILASSRFQMTIGFVGPLWLLELEQGDWFTMSSSRWRFEDKSFVVQARTITSDLKVTIVATETSTTISGWLPADEVPRTTTDSEHADYTLPIPELELEAIAYKNDDDVEVPAIVYDITIPIGSATRGFDLQIRRLGEVNSLQLPRIGLENAHGQVANSLLPSTVYQLRARSTDDRLYGMWSGWESVTTTDTVMATDTQNVGNLTAAQVAAAIQRMMDFIAALAAAVESANTDIDLQIIDVQNAIHDALEELGEISVSDLGLLAESIVERAVSQREADNTIRTQAVQIGDNAAAVLLEQSTRATADSAEATLRIALAAVVGANKSSYDSFVITQAGVDSAQTNSLTTLSSTVGTTNANLAAELITRANADTALAASITSLTATVGTNTSNISAEVVARTNADSTLAASITSLSSSFTAYQATVSSTYATYASQSSAISTLDTTLKAWVNQDTFGGNPLAATVAVQGIASTNLQGNVYGRYAMNVNANGNIAGITLLASTGRVDFSTVLIEAASFQIRSALATTIAPFTYDAISGTLFVQNVTIRNGNIENLAVTALKVANGALFVSNSAVATNGLYMLAGGDSFINSCSLTVEGGKVTILVNVYVHPVYEAPGGLSAREVRVINFSVYRNTYSSTSPISDLCGLQAVKLDLAGGDKYVSSGGWVSITMFDQPAAGTHTWQIRAQGVDLPCTFDYRSISVTENRRGM